MKFSAALLFTAASLVAAGTIPEEVVSSAVEAVETAETVQQSEPAETASAVETAPVDDETVYTTEVVTEYTTFCPEPTTITDGDNTITVTEPTTLTITHCPGGCTIERPVYVTSSVVCNDCPTGGNNATATFAPTGGVPEPSAEPSAEPSFPVEAGAAKLAGAGLAAFVGLVAFL